MPFAITVGLSEVACLQANPRSWPDRALFAFAFRAGGGMAVEFAGPRWMADGEAMRVEPLQSLFEAVSPDPRVAVAVRGYDVGREGSCDDGRLARALAASAIAARFADGDLPEGAGSAWEAGVEAIDRGIDLLVWRGERSCIFSFSKVYSVPGTEQIFSLLHTVVDPSGTTGSRYKVALGIGARPVGAGPV